MHFVLDKRHKDAAWVAVNGCRKRLRCCLGRCKHLGTPPLQFSHKISLESLCCRAYTEVWQEGQAVWLAT